MTTIEPANQQSISDDQELAKVLAGVNQGPDAAADASSTPAPLVPSVSTDDVAAPADDAAQTADPSTMLPTPDVAMNSEPSVAMPSAASTELDGIKQEALSELRPLVDKLKASAEEKFDTYVLRLPSPDDRALFAAAHDSA